jgi:hypothetical protein
MEGQPDRVIGVTPCSCFYANKHKPNGGITLQQKTLKLLSWMLILSLLVAALPGVALATERPVVAQAAPSDALSADALANATYESMLANGPVQLVDGKYEDTANQIVVVLADQPRAYGTLDGQEVAAVLISENGGGSGTFHQPGDCRRAGRRARQHRHDAAGRPRQRLFDGDRRRSGHAGRADPGAE